ncbi:hypothetical protein QBC46DRAFT_414763 [Diplogelasinospora grovesii]|uniref:Uncharacterized protein n=1 Tax=Diplogelasinospora grovesii TaxID=303347 RepID=A0AAN6MUA6_9PEZI|nr:hypothetical protein QBC46DRAFT_414763 [Diplogelasinospora grovesii]
MPAQRNGCEPGLAVSGLENLQVSSNPNPSGHRRKRDRSGENFLKRWRTIVKTLSELHQDHGAEFHISISRKHRVYVCRSRKDFLPVLEEDIVRTLSLVLPSLLRNKRKSATLRLP